MNRLGFDSMPGCSRHTPAEGCLSCALTLMMHFANADRADGASGPAAVAEQLARFEARRQLAIAAQPSNSAALFLHPQCRAIGASRHCALRRRA